MMFPNPGTFRTKVFTVCLEVILRHNLLNILRTDTHNVIINNFNNTWA